MLRAEGVADALKISNVDTRGFDKKNAQCMHLIATWLDSNHLRYAMNCEFAHEIVAKLDQLYACNDLATKQLLRQQWQSLRYVFDDDIHEFLCRFDGLVTDLQSAGCQLSDEEIVSQLLISMPREYNVTVKILRKMRDLNIQIAKQSLIADYNEERIQRQVSASGLSRHGNLSGGFNRNLTSSKIGRDTQGRNLRESKEHTQPFRCSLCGRRG